MSTVWEFLVCSLALLDRRWWLWPLPASWSMTQRTKRNVRLFSSICSVAKILPATPRKFNKMPVSLRKRCPPGRCWLLSGESKNLEGLSSKRSALVMAYEFPPPISVVIQGNAMAQASYASPKCWRSAGRRCRVLAFSTALKTAECVHRPGRGAAVQRPRTGRRSRRGARRVLDRVLTYVTFRRPMMKMGRKKAKRIQRRLKLKSRLVTLQFCFAWNVHARIIWLLLQLEEAAANFFIYFRMRIYWM